MRKIVLSAILSLLLVVSGALPALAAPSALAAVPQPVRTASPRDFGKLAPSGQLKASAVKAETAILIDERTGKTLFEKDADKKEFPASTTKIMTCLLALEKGNLSDTVTVDEVPQMEANATSIALAKGESMTLENLLYGLMLPSANDAAIVIAKYLGGSMEGFADMMNAKAKELGMTGTHYVNPNGLNDPEHYTTARDMATLARAARKYPEFCKIVSTQRYTIPATNKSEQRTLKNTNRLISTSDDEIYAYEYATGIKTGYTSAAEHALASSAQKGDVSLIAVVLRDEKLGKWTDSITMFEYGFQFYDTVDLTDALTSLELSADVPGSDKEGAESVALSLEVVPDGSLTLTDTKEIIADIKADPSLIEHTLTLKDGLTAPIEKGTDVGTITFAYNGEEIATCKLVAAQAVEAPGRSSKPTASAGTAVLPGGSDGILRYVLLGLGILLLAAAALVALRIVNLRRRSQRNRQYNYRYRTSSRRSRK